MLKNVGVRTKIFLVFAVPMLAVVGLAGASTWSLVGKYQQAKQIENVGERSTEAAKLARGLQWERSLTLMSMAAQNPEQKMVLDEKRKKIAAQLDAVSDISFENYAAARIGESTQNAIAGTDGLFERVKAARQVASSPNADPAAVKKRYDAIINEVITIPSIMANDVADAQLSALLRSYSISENTAQAAWDEALIVLLAAQAPEVSPEARAGLMGSLATQDTLARLNDDLARTAENVSRVPAPGEEILQARQAVLTAAPGQRVELNPTEYLEQFEKRLNGITMASSKAAELVVQRSSENAKAAATRLWMGLGIVLVTFAVSSIVAFIVARSFTRRLIRLTAAAEELRDVMPQLGRLLREGKEGIDVPVIQSRSNDEVGRLAKALNSVNATTVNSFSEQAALQKSISAMFINIARRDQVLLGRQLAFLDELEQHETNPENLNKLFSLDHLATRMRRNAESLLVLAGIETGRRPRRSMTMSDVIRIAASEIEDYERVECVVENDAQIHGRHALSAAHMIAELLENGCRFSNPGTRVFASVSVQHPVVRVEITDSGIGMGPDELRAANECISTKHNSDFMKTDKLGLYVVGRLARKLDVAVSLTSEQNSGSVVTIDFPEALFESLTEVEQAQVEQAATAAIPAQRSPQPEPVGALAGGAATMTSQQPHSEGAGAPEPVQYDFSRSDSQAAPNPFAAAPGQFGGQLDPGAVNAGASEIPAAMDGMLFEEEAPYQPETAADPNSVVGVSAPRGATAAGPQGADVSPDPADPGQWGNGPDPMVMEQMGYPTGQQPAVGQHSAVGAPCAPAPTVEGTAPEATAYYQPAQQPPAVDLPLQTPPQQTPPQQAAPAQPSAVAQQPYYDNSAAAPGIPVAQPGTAAPLVPVEPVQDAAQQTFGQPAPAAGQPDWQGYAQAQPGHGAPQQPEGAPAGYDPAGHAYGQPTQPPAAQEPYPQQFAQQPGAPVAEPQAPTTPTYAPQQHAPEQVQATPYDPSVLPAQEPQPTEVPPPAHGLVGQNLAPTATGLAPQNYDPSATIGVPATPPPAPEQAPAASPEEGAPVSPQQWQSSLANNSAAGQDHAPPDVTSPESFEESMRTLETASPDVLNPVGRPQHTAGPSTILPSAGTSAPRTPPPATASGQKQETGLKKLFGKFGGRKKTAEADVIGDTTLPTPPPYPQAAAPTAAPGQHPPPLPSAAAMPDNSGAPAAPEQPAAPTPRHSQDNSASHPTPMDLLASDRLAYGQRSGGGIGDTLRQRSEMASQALAELSMLSTYAPEQEGSGDAGSLARRQRGASGIPAASEPAPQVAARPRNAASVRSTMSGFTSGANRGRKK